MAEEATTPRAVTTEDLEKLSDGQLRQAQQIWLKRSTRKAREVMSKLLTGKELEIMTALTTAPFFYVTDEIRISAGMSIRMRSLNEAQALDSQKQLDKFMRDEDPNNLRVSNELNLLLLTHSLTTMNGMDFGGVTMPEDYHELVRTDPKLAAESMSEVRSRRYAALGALPVAIVQRLIEFYQVLQTTVDAVANDEKAGDVLGN
jgi:hypothetical protein